MGCSNPEVVVSAINDLRTEVSSKIGQLESENDKLKKRLAQLKATQITKETITTCETKTYQTVEQKDQIQKQFADIQGKVEVLKSQLRIQEEKIRKAEEKKGKLPSFVEVTGRDFLKSLLLSNEDIPDENNETPDRESSQPDISSEAVHEPKFLTPIPIHEEFFEAQAVPNTQHLNTSPLNKGAIHIGKITTGNWENLGESCNVTPYGEATQKKASKGPVTLPISTEGPRNHVPYMEPISNLINKGRPSRMSRFSETGKNSMKNFINNRYEELLKDAEESF